MQEDYQQELERKAKERQMDEFLREEEALLANKHFNDGINKLDDIWVRKNLTNAGANIKAKKQHENILNQLESKEEKLREIEEKMKLEQMMKKFQTEREPEFDFKLKQVSHNQLDQ